MKLGSSTPTCVNGAALWVGIRAPEWHGPETGARVSAVGAPLAILTEGQLPPAARVKTHSLYN